MRGEQRGRQRELLPDLLTAALMAVGDECPPETCMYLCSFGEDDTADCESCWRTYLRYVADGRRGDPYADLRIDAIAEAEDEGRDETVAEGGDDPYEAAAWQKDRRRDLLRRFYGRHIGNPLSKKASRN